MYVRSQHRNSKNHADCDWQAWVTKKCSSCHIPSELCTGVMSCGTACALSTLKAPSDMMQNCNVSMSRGGGKRAFSFRHNFYNTMNLCSTTGGAHHTLSSAFGRRGVANNQPEGNQTSSSLQKKTSNGHGREVSNGNLKRWCRAFSRFMVCRFCLLSLVARSKPVSGAVETVRQIADTFTHNRI